ncbi:MAG: cytochrome b/b6 domain-containing protein [Sulfuriferula sp.]
MSNNQSIKVWDLPVRLFHWGAVLCFIVSWASASLFDDTMQIHLYAGYTMLTLVAFRIVWGFAGSSTARFSNFVRGPRSIMTYVQTLRRPAPSHYLGHNPGGGWAVIAMLSLLLLQVVTGLFASDDTGDIQGPLAHWISDSASETISTVHSVAFDFLLGIIGFHIAAVLFYRFFKHDGLIIAMFTGRKTLIPGTTIPAIRFASIWRAALVFVLIASSVVVLVRLN